MLVLNGVNFVKSGYKTATANSKDLTLAMDSVAENESDDDHRIRCGSSFIKCIIVFINLIFMVIGLVLIGFVIWIHTNRENLVYSRILEDLSSTPSFHSSISNLHHHQQQQQHHIPSSFIHRTTTIVVVALVVVIIAFGFLGCCGASVESVCFLCMCSLLIVSAVTAQIVLASMFRSIKEKMYNDLLLRMQHQIRTEYNRMIVASVVDQQHQSTVADIEQLTVAWNTLQIRFNCCGASGPRDFRLSAWYNQTNDGDGVYVPRTCCVLTEPNADQPRPRNEPFCQIEALLIEKNDRPVVELQQIGCHEAVTSYIDSYFHHPFLVTIFVAMFLLQVTDVIFCCILTCRIRRQLSEIDQSVEDESEAEEGADE